MFLYSNGFQNYLLFYISKVSEKENMVEYLFNVSNWFQNTQFTNLMVFRWWIRCEFCQWRCVDWVDWSYLYRPNETNKSSFQRQLFQLNYHVVKSHILEEHGQLWYDLNWDWPYFYRKEYTLFIPFYTAGTWLIPTNLSFTPAVVLALLSCLIFFYNEDKFCIPNHLFERPPSYWGRNSWNTPYFS